MAASLRFLVLCVGLCVAAIGCLADASAQPVPLPTSQESGQTTAISTDGLTQNEIRALMSRLSDDQVRALLLEQLDRNAAPDAASAISLAQEIEANSAVIRERIGAILAAAPDAPQAIGVMFTQIGEAGGIGLTAIALVVVFAIGLGARWLWHRRIVNSHQDRIAARNAAQGGFASISVFGDALVWLLLELSGVVIFFVVAWLLVFAIWYDNEVLRLVLSTYVRALAITLTVMAIAEFYLPRNWPVYRLIRLDDAATRRAKAYLLAATILWTFGFSTCHLLHQFGAPKAPHDFLILLVATAFILVLMALFMSLRRDIAVLIRGEGGDTGGWSHARNLLASGWHLLAIAYALLLWLMSLANMMLRETGGAAGGIGPGLKGLILIVAVPAIDSIAGSYINARLGPDTPLAGAIRRMLRVFLIVGAAVIFFNMWGFDISQIEAAGVAGWLVTALVDIAIVALIGYAIWQLMRAWFDTLLERAAPEAEQAGQEAGGEAEGGPGATRAETLLPLLRTFTLATIIVMAILTALAGIGVDIGPLLAGAGVVGIAIGFGAQTLVKDVVSGFFFLLDDAFRMGEYIDVGAAKGVVEKISVRSLRLRHHRGPLNTVPFGEIATLTNYSRDWVIMKLPLRLTYDTDPQRVKKIIKRIAAEMQEDPMASDGLIEPPKSQGVLQMDDSAMILRVKFMAKPGKQFIIRRELLHRIRAAFEAEGIQFAAREVTVRVAGEHDEETVREAGAAAARTIIDQEAAEAAAPGANPADAR